MCISFAPVSVFALAEDTDELNAACDSLVAKKLEAPELRISTAEAANGRIELFWDSLEGAAYYTVEHSTDGVNYVTLINTEETFCFDEVAPQATCWYRVKAIGDDSHEDSEYADIGFTNIFGKLEAPELRISTAEAANGHNGADSKLCQKLNRIVCSGIEVGTFASAASGG